MKQSELEHAQAAIERLRLARAELADEQFTASSEDGYVTVTVDAAGYPAELTFDPRAFRSPIDSEGLAASTMNCWRQARELADQHSQDATDAVQAAARGTDQAGLADRLEAMGRALLGREQQGGRDG